MKRLLAFLLLASCKPAPAAPAAPPAPRAAGAVAGEWPTYHGGYALDGLADPAPPDAPVLRWRYKAGARIEAPPLVAGGRIFAATSKGGLVALGADGQELWTASIGKEIAAPPLYAGGLLLAGTGDGVLHAVDAATGKERWSYATGDSIHGAPNRVDLGGGRAGAIVISQADGVIHGLDLATGKLEWKTPGVERCDGSPSSLDGRMVMGSCASALHVFEAAKPGKSADVELGGDGQVAGGVALSGGQAFTETHGGKVVAADLAGAKVLWTNDESKGEAFGTPAVDARRVITGAKNGKVRSLDRATGATQWTYDAKDAPTSPVLAGNRVVLAAGGTLLLLDAATGALVWSSKVSDELSGPAVAGGVIYVGGDDGTVTAWGAK